MSCGQRRALQSRSYYFRNRGPYVLKLRVRMKNWFFHIFSSVSGNWLPEPTPQNPFSLIWMNFTKGDILASDDLLFSVTSFNLSSILKSEVNLQAPLFFFLLFQSFSFLCLKAPILHLSFEVLHKLVPSSHSTTSSTISNLSFSVHAPRAHWLLSDAWNVSESLNIVSVWKYILPIPSFFI